MLLALSASFYTGCSFGLIYGAANMIQSHAYICNTMFCIYIVLIGYCRGKRPNAIEILGLIVTVAAVSLMLADPEAIKTNGTRGTPYAYAVCFGCAFIGALWIMANEALIN